MTPAAASAPATSGREYSLYKPMLAMAVFALLVAYAGFYVFQQIEEIFKDEELEELGSISDVKANQLAAWRNGQIRVGETLSRNSVLAQEFGQWLQAGALPDERMHQLRKMLEEVRLVSGYTSIVLLDSHGVARISPVANTDIDGEEARLALQAMTKREVLFYDIHRNSRGDKGISIDLIAPLIVAGKNHNRAVGAAVLQIDPNLFLYPTILSWPTTDASAESLLVRKEGNDVLYLNALRFRSSAALAVRIPLDTPKLPAAMAVLGQFGTGDGIDYRGVRVVAEMRPVPGTSWFVVSKVDRAELLAPVTRLKQLSMGMGIALAAIGALIMLFWYRGQMALRRSAEQIADLYNNAPCGYQSLDKDGVIIQVNNTELNWLGYARDEIVGKLRFMDLLAPASQRAFQLNYSGFKDSGYIHDVEYELLRKDGTSFPVLLNASAIYDDDGQYVMSRATMFDITARKLVENRLAESEARFRTMADNAPIMIWMAEAQGQQDCLCCNYFNQRWHEFTGMQKGQTPSCNWQDFIHDGDRKRCLDVYANALQNRQAFKVEYRLRCRDGVFRWIEDSGVPRFSADGEYLGFIGICIDITGRMLFEVLRGEMAHIDRLNIAGEMASGLAHELSQPLASASNYLEACLRGMDESNWDAARLKKMATQAHAQTERAGQIIKHLKELISKQKFERGMLDINSAIRDSIRFLEHELQQNSISVTLDLSTLPPVRANKIEIEQVLTNLIKNAIDSMCDAPRRELRIASSAIESGYVLVKVSDTGKGIAEDDTDKVFDAFYTSKKEGLGLGLAICRSLVENYGGKIWVEQNEDEGIEFNFTLSVGADL